MSTYRIYRRNYWGKQMSNTNKILKAAVILAIALAFIMPGSATFTKSIGTLPNVTPQEKTSNSVSRDVLFSDSFESYADFVVDAFPPWTTYDGDLGGTYGINGYTWPNVYYVGSFMIFNPSQTTPSLGSQYPAHTGAKYATCWDTVTAYAPNDDWLFTPQLSATTYDHVTFWARSLNNQYGLENFTVGVSTTNTNPASFTKISPGIHVQPPVTWTSFSYDISSYSGHSIYIGIHVISDDVFAFFLDDFSVTGSGGHQPLTAEAGGPYTASAGENISFAGSATGGTAPYTWSWDFGNGATSTEQNPVYAYPLGGVYTVTLTVTDSANPANTANDTATATITCPIEITQVKGGFGLSISVKNNGTTNLTAIPWTVTFKGGIIIPPDKSGTIDLNAGETKIIKVIPIGFGKPQITITVGCAETSVTALVILFFVLGVK